MTPESCQKFYSPQEISVDHFGKPRFLEYFLETRFIEYSLETRFIEYSLETRFIEYSLETRCIEYSLETTYARFTPLFDFDFYCFLQWIYKWMNVFRECHVRLYVDTRHRDFGILARGYAITRNIM